jgi:transposase
MEATGSYWKPIWAVLEDDFECVLVNARHVKQVPGCKTDLKDAQWLCQLLEAGRLKASLVPPKPIRTLRNLTRYRKSQIRDRQREANRLHKVLQETGIKLDCVASDLLGKSGRAMLDALVAGTTDPELLADLARGQPRKKLPALREALAGRFSPEHSLVVGRILAHIDFLDEAIAQLSEAIEQQIAPLAPAVELLCTIPGVGRRAAEVIIAETGGDMSAFPTAKHLTSWAGVCPGNDLSARTKFGTRRQTFGNHVTRPFQATSSPSSRSPKLGQDGRHVPPTSTPNTQTVLGRDDRAEAVPLELEGPPRAGGQRPGAGKHRVRQPQELEAIPPSVAGLRLSSRRFRSFRQFRLGRELRLRSLGRHSGSFPRWPLWVAPRVALARLTGVVWLFRRLR